MYSNRSHIAPFFNEQIVLNFDICLQEKG
jgi:hypothetical protein